jgi:hypothetical protein
LKDGVEAERVAKKEMERCKLNKNKVENFEKEKEKKQRVLKQ